MSGNKVFPKPSFDDLLAAYNTDPNSVHSCNIIDPAKVNTCAARMSEALVIANAIVSTRADISAKGTGKEENGVDYLLGEYGYGTTANTGKLCSHGIGRGAQDLAAFLKRHWDEPKPRWTAQKSDNEVPNNVIGKKGVVAFMKIPQYPGVQGHIDLWNDTAIVGSQYWGAKTIWFWELS